MITFAMPALSPLVHALLVLTASRDAAVEVTADTVAVRLGLTWRTEFPRNSIVAAEPDQRRTISSARTAGAAAGWSTPPPRAWCG